MKKTTPNEQKELFPAVQQRFNSIEEFTRLINTSPSKADIRTNKFANNSEYIPIGTIENRLDEIYSGMWQIENCKVQLMCNSVQCTLDLVVMHPSGQWLRRSGVGACPIEVEKGANPIDISKLNAKAIQKNAPAAKSYALRNAAQSLGAYFGRNLNREDVDYMPLSEQLGGADVELAYQLLNTSIFDEAKRKAYEVAIKKGNPKSIINIITNLKQNQKND